MKPIRFNTIINRISTKSDGSLGLTMETPEMSNEQILVMLRLRGINLDCELSPLNEELEPPEVVKSEVQTKTASERLRAVLFVLFKNDSGTPTETFDSFYSRHMEKLIDFVKAKLPEQ